jgi:hypothetical protein
MSGEVGELQALCFPSSHVSKMRCRMFWKPALCLCDGRAHCKSRRQGSTVAFFSQGSAEWQGSRGGICKVRVVGGFTNLPPAMADETVESGCAWCCIGFPLVQRRFPAFDTLPTSHFALLTAALCPFLEILCRRGCHFSVFDSQLLLSCRFGRVPRLVLGAGINVHSTAIQVQRIRPRIRLSDAFKRPTYPKTRDQDTLHYLSILEIQWSASIRTLLG